MQNAINELWPFAGELFLPAAYETAAAKAGVGVDVSALKELWLQKVQEIFAEATLAVPAVGTWSQSGGKEGVHTEHFGFILADLQFMQRAYPGMEW